jgi:VWFA-related protein
MKSPTRPDLRRDGIKGFFSVLLVMLLAPWAVSQNRQTTPPRSANQNDVVELRSDLVTVTATIVMPNGTLVTDLHQEDFELLEDGVAQRIVTFSSQAKLPLALVMIFDVSESVRHRLQFEKDAASRFFRSIMRPVDRASIVAVSTDVTIQQKFTSDAGQLASAIGRMQAEGTTALYDAIVEAAELLRYEDGRRVIVVLSDGKDIISRASLLEALRRAQEADAVIYAVNTSGRPVSANDRDLAGERALETMANRTGGEVFFPNRLEELDPVFARLAEQLRTQYVIGYSSSNTARDGSYRRIALRVKREGAYARARQGYYAPKK